MKTESEQLAAWQQRCAAGGLLVTAARSAILQALLEQDRASDAVTLLQAAQCHHADTRIAAVYRFLRELEVRGWIDAQAQAHGRMRWSLPLSSRGEPVAGADDALALAALRERAARLGYQLLPAVRFAAY